MTNAFMRSAILIVAAAVLLSPSSVAAQMPDASWWERTAERRAGHYTIKTDLPPERARELARHLNLMYDAYARRLAALPQRAPEKLNVMIFARRQDYLDVLRVRFGVNAQGTGGLFFVNPLGTALAFWTEGLPDRRVLHVAQHEGFHQFAWSRFGNDLPVWTNEGLAEFFGEAVLIGSELLIGQSTPRTIDAVKEAISSGRSIPFETMLTLDGAAWNDAVHDGDASLQYHQAWSMVHFLVYGDGGRYAEPFSDYLRLLNRGVRSRDAFVQVFGADLGPFEQRWKAYAMQCRPSAMVTAAERIEFLAEGALALARRGVVPGSLNELRDRLVDAGFSYQVTSHGWRADLDPADRAMYTIPRDERSGEDDPMFVVESPNINRMTRRERTWNETRPRPPDITTAHLRPRDLTVRWQRDRKTGELSYEIAAK